MSPKEKAKELVDKIFNQLKSWGNPSYENAKQGALIVVDEIIKALLPFEYGLECVAKIEFWNNVKQEIEKL